MFFAISNRMPSGVISQAFLAEDNWDDWGKYRTQFYLRVADEKGVIHDIGPVKIGKVGLRPGYAVEPGQRSPQPPQQFEVLDANYFSLGQGEDYYQALNELSEDLRSRVLIGLRDIANSLEILDANRTEEVMSESLLRSVHETNVRNRLHRITQGDATLTRFSFQYTLPHRENLEPPIITFDVIPESVPPTNVHVLIGRNGVGKSRCIRGLIESLLGRPGERNSPPGRLELFSDGKSDWSFAGLVLVSFSAFDDFNLEPQEHDSVGARQIGLRRSDEVGLKSIPELAVDFSQSLSNCRQSLKAARWRDAVRNLEKDDLFAEANVTTLFDQPEDENWDRRAEALFKRLSSGHAIILLTITRLVELVDEKTLVLLDEPEGHLHPPLLAAFIRGLSDLLVKRNAVAIIATHSPVVLQEVPQTCAWKLRRSKDVSVVERPSVETFGENIGLLTREIFGLEVTHAGFHDLLKNSVDSGMSFDEVLQYFNGQLGMEAQAIVQALIALRDQP